MRFSYEYKIESIDMYRSGIYPETPEGISESCFRSKVRQWSRIEKNIGIEGLKPKNQHKVWTPEEKLALVSQVLAGNSCLSVALEAGINDGMLYQWVRKYKIYGYNGLIDKEKGRKSNNPDMKKGT